jgi:hypothetical protein
MSTSDTVPDVPPALPPDSGSADASKPTMNPLMLLGGLGVFCLFILVNRTGWALIESTIPLPGWVFWIWIVLTVYAFIHSIVMNPTGWTLVWWVISLVVYSMFILGAWIIRKILHSFGVI